MLYLAQPLGGPTAILLAYLWLSVLVVGWFLLVKQSNSIQCLGSFSFRILLSGILWGLGLLVIGEVGRAASRLVGLEQQLQINPRGAVELALALAIPIIVAPVVEELAFRGLILGRLRNLMSQNYAILLSAALFSVYHASAYQLLPTFLLGVGLAFLVIRTNSLWAAIIAHAFFNIFSLLIAISVVTPLS